MFPERAGQARGLVEGPGVHQTDHDHHDDPQCWYKGGPFRNELTSHLPFSMLSVTLGLVLAGLICFFTDDAQLASAQRSIEAVTAHDHGDHGHDHAGGTEADGSTLGFLVLFHLFHPAHMLFSGAATAAMFYRYERRVAKALIVGFSGAVLVCGISDIAMPSAALVFLGKNVHTHICVLEHPMLVLPFAATGVALGVLAASGGVVHSTIFSHSLHVAVSTMASIFFMIGAFGRLEWINDLGVVFLCICLAVMIPCCLSDIVYPLIFTRPAREEFFRSGHDHPH